MASSSAVTSSTEIRVFRLYPPYRLCSTLPPVCMRTTGTMQFLARHEAGASTPGHRAPAFFAA